MNNDHFPEFDNDAPVGGYILTFIHENEDGTKVTKTRFVKPEHNEAVEKYIEDYGGIYMQEDVIDKFLSTLQ